MKEFKNASKGENSSKTRKTSVPKGFTGINCFITGV